MDPQTVIESYLKTPNDRTVFLLIAKELKSKTRLEKPDLQAIQEINYSTLRIRFEEFFRIVESLEMAGLFKISKGKISRSVTVRKGNEQLYDAVLKILGDA